MVEVVLALPVGQAIVQLAGLSVDQVRGERTGVAPEQGVRQRDVAPQEADQMQPHQQDDHGVDQPVDGVLPYAAVEQRPVRQGELQMPGDQNRVERLAVCSSTRAVTTPTASTDGSVQSGRGRAAARTHAELNAR